MFKKKVWKRGNKLNAKELNRIEEGIANSGNWNTITVNIDVTDMMTTGLSYSDWSISVEEFKKLCEKKQKICLICDEYHRENDKMNYLKTDYLYSTEIDAYVYKFISYITGVGLACFEVKWNEETNEIKASSTPQILVPDAE